MAYIDCSSPLAYGSLTPGPEPVLIDAPEGAQVKLRFRNRDAAKAFIRHPNGSFSAWYLQWVGDHKERRFKLLSPIGYNHRPKAQQP